MTRYRGIVSLKLELWIEAKNKKEAIEYLENMELPKGYLEDSFNIELLEWYKD